MSGEGLHRTAAIQTTRDIAAELRLGQYGEARRLHGVLGEQIDAAEVARASSEEESR